MVKPDPITPHDQTSRGAAEGEDASPQHPDNVTHVERTLFLAHTEYHLRFSQPARLFAGAFRGLRVFVFARRSVNVFCCECIDLYFFIWLVYLSLYVHEKQIHLTTLQRNTNN